MSKRAWEKEHCPFSDLNFWFKILLTNRYNLPNLAIFCRNSPNFLRLNSEVGKQNLGEKIMTAAEFYRNSKSRRIRDAVPKKHFFGGSHPIPTKHPYPPIMLVPLSVTARARSAKAPGSGRFSEEIAAVSRAPCSSRRAMRSSAYEQNL